MNNPTQQHLNNLQTAKFYDPISDGFFFSIPSVEGWVRRNQNNKNKQQFHNKSFVPFVTQQQFQIPPTSSSITLQTNQQKNYLQSNENKPFYLKDLTDAEVENIIVQHSQSAPRESTIFEHEKNKIAVDKTSNNFQDLSVSWNQPEKSPCQRGNYSPVPLYQRQACHNLPKSKNSWPKMFQKQKFNNAIKREINNFQEQQGTLNVGSFDDPIECDYSDSDKPTKSLEKTSSLSSMDDSMTTLSHLSDLNISDEQTFNANDSINSGMQRPNSLRYKNNQNLKFFILDYHQIRPKLQFSKIIFTIHLIS